MIVFTNSTPRGAGERIPETAEAIRFDDILRCLEGHGPAEVVSLLRRQLHDGDLPLSCTRFPWTGICPT